MKYLGHLSAVVLKLSLEIFKDIHLNSKFYIIQYVTPNLRLTQKYAFIKKSTIFTQSLRNFVKYGNHEYHIFTLSSSSAQKLRVLTKLPFFDTDSQFTNKLHTKWSLPCEAFFSLPNSQSLWWKHKFTSSGSTKRVQNKSTTLDMCDKISQN